MKPIKLEIEGLNSFESNQVLEFDKLGDGVFGIFGNTGSGKSTILDAITLALYGKIERSKQNIDFINIKKQKAIVLLTFEINQHGKNNIYEVVRTFTKKKTGKLIDSSAVLYQIEGDSKNMIEEGTVKVNDKIFSIIGLGVNEFSKCIALPQGEFSAFLQAKPAERIEIMSNIFSLDKYGDSLSFAVREKLNEYDKELSVLTASKELLSTAKDETVADMQNKLNETKKKYEQASSILKEKSEEFAKAEKAIEQQEELDKINTELAELEKQKLEIQELEEITSKAQNANELKSDFLKLKKIQQDEKELAEKIAGMNELKLQKQTEFQQSQQEFEDIKTIYETKLIELNKKITVLEEIENCDDEVAKIKQEQEKLKVDIEDFQKQLSAEFENNAYIENQLETISNDIAQLDEFINANKPEVEKCYALEQVKDVESEYILIEDFYSKIDSMIENLSLELKEAEDNYNKAIRKEKTLKQKQEEIKQSLKVVFGNENCNLIQKLRTCDKELMDFQSAENYVMNLENIIDKLKGENERRLDVIAGVRIKIEKATQNLSEYERLIEDKNSQILNLNEIREEMLGENVISLISDNLKIGDFCPVCSARVVQKIYSEKNNLGDIEKSIFEDKENHRSMLLNRDKLLAEIVTLKSRIEFEKTQIEINDSEITEINIEISKVYQKFVDNNDSQKDNFSHLKSLINDTAAKLEELIILQEKLREEELEVCLTKSQFGTKVVCSKTTLESLFDILQDLQKKKAEREFILLNSAAELEKIEDYKKFIADGKNLEIELDANIKQRQHLKDCQFKLLQDKGASDRKILEIKSNIQVLNQKFEGDEKQISNLLMKAVSSGVPEGVLIVDEKNFTKETLSNLKKEYFEKQSLFETRKEEFTRIENDYKINTTILRDKELELENLKNIVENNMVKFNFSTNEEVEKLFIENVEIKQNIVKINKFNNDLENLRMQKNNIESKMLEEFDKDKLNALKNEISYVSIEVNKLAEDVGKNNAQLEILLEDNKKLKDIESSLLIAKHNYDLAKELNSVLRGKALAEYFCEEYLQEITESANEKLHLLMDGRYTLKFENKEFYVEDNFSDGVIRSASTLSGGETFIVSLSLALSISDAISLLSSRSIDFFFLDEGFGTLDADLCGVVISALHKLESQNLKIGLISHVAELAESVKNKVIVTKDANGSKIRIEHSL